MGNDRVANPADIAVASADFKLYGSDFIAGNDPFDVGLYH